jgi:hypothetical protein
LCGSLPDNTDFDWVELTCNNGTPVVGGYVKLVTVTSEPMHIVSIDVYGVQHSFGYSSCINDADCQGNLVCDSSIPFEGVVINNGVSYTSGHKVCVYPPITWKTMADCPAGKFADWFNG